jgi:hypothetical protein
MNISAENYWDNTLQACKTAVGLLSAFEGDNTTLINNAIESLRQLIHHASDFESLKAFQSQVEARPSRNDSVAKGKQVLDPRENTSQFHLEPSWTMVDDRTVNITIESTGTVIVAKTVTTPEQLDSLITRMYEIGKVSLDCEFIAFKEGQPQLQILQVAVSTTEGYAIIIDKVGLDALNTKLKPCLEDPKMNFIGWAFRSDASAIERTLKGILIAPILDLQAKLRPIAVEEMNLYAGVSKYASDWDAIEEFQKVKLQGDSFDYLESNCIWLQDPLPPAALVYAVFDVVSLEALFKATEAYPTDQDHFWPYTVTKNTNPKAINNFHKQRAVNYATVIVDTKDLKNQTGQYYSHKKSHSKKRKSFNNSSQYDPETQYKDDMQKALYLSLQEAKHPSSPGHWSSSKAEDRVVDFDASGLQFSDLGSDSHFPPLNAAPHFADRVEEEKEEEPVLESTWSDIVNEKQKPFLGLGWIETQDNSNDSKSSDSPVPASPVATNKPKITIMKRLVEPTKSTSPQAQNVEQIPDSSASNSSQVRQMFNAKPKRPSQDSTSNDINTLFNSKPDRSSYARVMKTSGGVANQTGTFSWEDDTYNGQGGRAWKEFAQTAKTGWTNNVDTDPNDIDEIKASAETATTKMPREEVRFNTSSANVWHSMDVLSSDHNEWNVEIERPTFMKMPITKFEKRKTKGPRIINPIDSDISDDDSDQDSDNDDDGAVGSSNIKNSAGNDEESGSDERNSSDQSVTNNSANSFSSHNQNQWSKWSHRNYTGNQYSRRSSHERNNGNNGNNSNSRSTRGSWGYSGDQRYNENYNNSNSSNNYDHNSNYNTNYVNGYNHRFSHNNNNNKSNHRNSGSSSSSSSAPQLAPAKQVVTTNTAQNYYELEIYVNELYTNTGDYIKIFKLNEPSHLDQIILPSLDVQFTVAITFQLFASSNDSDPQLKALQFYLPDNSSFNVIVGKACHENSTETTLNSKLNTLLAHPEINRVAWFPEYFDARLKERTGVEIGRVVDLGVKVHSLDDMNCGANFFSVINHYLKDWPSLDQFITAKENYDNSMKSKFSCVWDRDRVADSTLEYSSLQGAALFKLYHHNTFYSVPDDQYIHKRK